MAVSSRDQAIINKISECHSAGDWKEAWRLHQSGEEGTRAILWPRPGIEDLHFISQCVRSLGLKKIVSIGCGTGFLEWLLASATGLEVEGVEIDKKYWSLKWSRRRYIVQVFPEDEEYLEAVTSPKSALLFCYFNNPGAWESYVENYLGAAVIVVGHEGPTVRTCPSPLSPGLPRNSWRLSQVKEIASTRDYIALYTRTPPLSNQETLTPS